ncbi:iron ABC transporter permease [Sphingomonas sp. HDW15A]|uniref:FecCD family ABC transporter permease n=1 Tax=Sphingomonas sp. HDW15A TaxID=2714942 RepID=UPI00140CF472|nr:iron ABC transporter permease [Sphingomonas sp. HDW15A]QIK96050.1 iron ABC transporter permease [Sphingomonas sp. HDW15A]
MSRITIAIGLLLLAAAHLLLPWAPVEAIRLARPELLETFLFELRAPRTMLALGYGATLGLTGAALQALFANPLASPDLTGSTGGAALGAVIAAYWLGLSSPLAMAFAGAVGALCALALLVILAGRRAEPASLLLAGLAIALAAGAATSLSLALAPSPFAFYDAFDWLMGSFADRSLAQAAVALIPAGLAGVLIARRANAIDLLVLGEDVVAAAGLRPRRLALEIIVLSSIAVGACVAVCGAIGFVGLIAPVIARRISAGHPGRAMIPAAAIGASLVVAADLVSRMVEVNRSIPVGVLTTIAGTPIFIAILLSMRRRLTS